MERGKKGRLIVFEGPDASGLTTHSRIAAQVLNAVYTKEPTGGPIGEIIRRILVSPRGHTAEELALLFAADRMNHLYGKGGVLEDLLEGRIVVMDRYKYSSIAYQSAGHPELGSASPDWLWSINRYAPPPHILVYLEAPLEALKERLAARRSLQTYESPGILSSVIDSFRRNVLSRLPETCSPTREPWATKTVNKSPLYTLYPQGCYPVTIKIRTIGSIKEINEKIVKTIREVLREIE